MSKRRAKYHAQPTGPDRYDPRDMIGRPVARDVLARVRANPELEMTRARNTEVLIDTTDATLDAHNTELTSTYSRADWEDLLDHLRNGQTLVYTCNTYAGMPRADSVRRWIRSNPQLKMEFDEAMTDGAEAMEQEAVDILDQKNNSNRNLLPEGADANTPLAGETDPRSKMRAEYRWKMAQVRNDRYNLAQKVDVTHRVDLADVQQRASQAAERSLAARERVVGTGSTADPSPHALEPPAPTITEAAPVAAVHTPMPDFLKMENN